MTKYTLLHIMSLVIFPQLSSMLFFRQVTPEWLHPTLRQKNVCTSLSPLLLSRVYLSLPWTNLQLSFLTYWIGCQKNASVLPGVNNRVETEIWHVTGSSCCHPAQCQQIPGSIGRLLWMTALWSCATTWARKHMVFPVSLLPGRKCLTGGDWGQKRLRLKPESRQSHLAKCLY